MHTRHSTHRRFSDIGTGLMALLLWSALLMTGCSTPMDARKDTAFQSHAHAADRPTQRPVRSLSNFSDSLACMDRLFRDAQLPTTLITSKQIPDASGRVPVASKEMVITAISQMSRLSNAFRYVDFEVDVVRQDTVQNLTTILLNSNQIQLQRPALYVSGAISFVDQNVINNSFDLGTSASRLETGFSKDKSATIIGLELHLGEFRTRTLIPGLDSANEVVIGNGGQGMDLAGRIGNYGWQLNVGRDYSQGSGAAMRTLVELALIELTGKWARVPYWQCLTLDQAHPGLQRQLREWYEEGQTPAHDALVRKSLMASGYLNASASALPINHPTIRSAIAKYQADQGMVVSGEIDFMTYERALRHYVMLGEKGELIRVGWSPETASTPVASVHDGQVTNIPQGAPLDAAPDPLRLNMQVENLAPDKSTFEQGTQIFLSATVSRSAYLYCYLTQAEGRVMRLLPNPTNPSALVSANQAIRIPDWMTPTPGFLLDAGSPGEESVTCLASDTDLTNKLPEPLRTPGLRTLKGVNGMASIREAHKQATGESAFAEQTLGWRVVPKRVAASR